MSAVMREAFFLPRRDGGQCFCLLSGPSAEHSRGAVLYVHPFAEEMNKSRRMAALAAAALAREGWTVLQTDLLGCGDSSGEFTDASWGAWVADVDLAHECLVARGFDRVAAWGLRAGCLLITAWLAQRGVVAPLVLWQPVTSGKQHLNQFLRLKGVSGMLDERDAKAVMATMRADLLAGKSVEVAGYGLSSALVTELEGAKLDLPAGYSAPVRIFEVSASGDAACSPAVGALAKRLVEGGVDVAAHALAGPSFWQTQEIEECEGLVAETVRAMEDIHGLR